MMHTAPDAAAIQAQLERLRAGDRRALARAISAVEDGGAEAEALLRAVFPATGRARVTGVTGAPGSGKSTLAEKLIRAWRRRGERVGVVAVDPSSPFTGGALLGDRIRMQSHHADSGVFIRSLATRGALGGLARAARDVAALLDAAGFERLLIETVGVGQDEVDIVRVADITLLVLVPGLGDEVQAIKAGVMEIADIFVLNKADRGVERLRQEVAGLLSLAPRAEGEWEPPIVETVATEDRGIDELCQAIDARWAWMEAHGGLVRQRGKQWLEPLRQLLRDRLVERLLGGQLDAARLEPYAAAIARRDADPYTAADQIIAAALKRRSS